MKLPLARIQIFARSEFTSIRELARAWLQKHCQPGTDAGEQFLRWQLNRCGSLQVIEDRARTLVDMGEKIVPRLVSQIVTGSSCDWYVLTNALRQLGPRMSRESVQAVLSLLRADQGRSEALAEIAGDVLRFCPREVVIQLSSELQIPLVPGFSTGLDRRQPALLDSTCNWEDALKGLLSRGILNDDGKAALLLQAPAFDSSTIRQIATALDYTKDSPRWELLEAVSEVLSECRSELTVPILGEIARSNSYGVDCENWCGWQAVVATLLAGFGTDLAFDTALELTEGKDYVTTPVAIGVRALGQFVGRRKSATTALLKLHRKARSRCDGSWSHTALYGFSDQEVLTDEVVVEIAESLSAALTSCNEGEKHYRYRAVLVLGANPAGSHLAKKALLKAAQTDHYTSPIAWSAIGGLGDDDPEMISLLTAILDQDVSDWDLSHSTAANALHKLGPFARFELEKRMAGLEMLKGNISDC